MGLLVVIAATPQADSFLQELASTKTPMVVYGSSDRLHALSSAANVAVRELDELSLEGPPEQFGGSIEIVYLFEHSLSSTTSQLHAIRSWTNARILVITQGQLPARVYHALGANAVVYSQSGDLTFLVPHHNEQGA